MDSTARLRDCRPNCHAALTLFFFFRASIFHESSGAVQNRRPRLREPDGAVSVVGTWPSCQQQVCALLCTPRGSLCTQLDSTLLRTPSAAALYVG